LQSKVLSRATIVFYMISRGTKLPFSFWSLAAYI
jgi:hypothetical protein